MSGLHSPFPDNVRWLIEPLGNGEGSRREREHALARVLLSRLLGEERVRLEHDERGAPCLPDYRGVHISISHCRTAVAVAVSTEGEVGIDVECRRRISDGLMERVCTVEELANVRVADDSEMAFLQLWTRKEAVLKWRRTGIEGFSSLLTAATEHGCNVRNLPCPWPDVVAALAW